jgi:nucleoside-diphosphate-sugar epimerase
MSHDRNKTIFILGAGWLGTQLAESLSPEYSVITSSTSSRDDLPNHHVIKLPEEYEKLNAITKSIDVMVISLPPLANLSNIIEKVNEMNLNNCQIIMFSSISVYGDQTGTLNSQSPTQPVTQNAITFCEAEKELMQHNSSANILRFGGLIGKIDTQELFGRQISSQSPNVYQSDPCPRLY